MLPDAHVRVVAAERLQIGCSRLESELGIPTSTLQFPASSPKEVPKTQQASVITDEMRAAIGQESDPVTFEVDKNSCRMFARAVGYSDPVFYDEAAARSAGYRSIPAPPGFLGHPVIVPGQPNPLATAYFRFDTPLKRRLNGGTDIEYLGDVCAGDVLTATAKLVDIS